MLKFVFYCILAYLAIRFVRWLIKPSRARSGRGGGARRGATMVRCETCGTFITQGSALAVGGHDFCSQPCLEQRARRV